jgi:hypothetical protein
MTALAYPFADSKQYPTDGEDYPAFRRVQPGSECEVREGETKKLGIPASDTSANQSLVFPVSVLVLQVVWAAVIAQAVLVLGVAQVV